jgi:hypothetical protein
MSNKWCYIAGKIGNMPESVYRPMFEEAAKEVRAMGLKPVLPIDLPHNHGKTWCEYMREDIKTLMLCGHVYAMKNWRHSEGATIEVNLAVQVGINVIHQK